MTDKQFEACIHRMCKGDQNGLKEVYEEYITFIYSVIFDVLKNKDNAEDITSEFFIKIWNVSNQYNAGNGHRAWLARIAKNMAIDFIRKHKREELTDEIDSGDTKSSVEEEVISDLSLTAALNTLNEKEREIINLKILGDMTFKEISKALRIPMGTVTWRYQNAINKLRRCGYE